MTDIVDNTVRKVLDRADPNTLADGLRMAGIGGALNSLGDEKTKSGTVPATPHKVTLDHLAMPGSLRVASGTGALAEYVGASAVAAGEFKTTVVGGVTVVEFHSGQEAAAYVIKYLTQDLCGADNSTPLQTALAADYEGSNPR